MNIQLSTTNQTPPTHRRRAKLRPAYGIPHRSDADRRTAAIARAAAIEVLG